WFFASGHPQRQNNNRLSIASAGRELLIYLKTVPSSAGLLVLRLTLCLSRRVNSEFERKFGRRSSGSFEASIEAAFHSRPAPGFHLGGLNLKFPDRRRCERRRPRTEYLGCLLSKRRSEEPRHRRCCVRPLPSLPGGCRPDETAVRSGISVLGCLAAGAAAGTRIRK